MRILLVTPPMTQLNTPYPATAYLTGFLRERGYDVVQADPALELVLALLSRNGLLRIRERLGKSRAPVIQHFKKRFDDYLNCIEPAIRFLQGRDSTLASRIASRAMLPEGPRFQSVSTLEEIAGGGLEWAFGALGVQDRAKYLATLFIDDLADVIREGIDARFEFSRYAEKLAASSPTFDPIESALHAEPTLVDEMLDEITDAIMNKHGPDVVGMTVPFPGNVYGAFRMAKRAKASRFGVKTVLGGGFVNTELRSLSEPKVFDYFDYITLDDGERPFLSLLEYFDEKLPKESLLRTFVREDGKVKLISGKSHDIPQKETGTPTYDGLPLGSYLSVLEMLNPMHRLWSDGRWNKLTLAHGCYWKKCNFCDISLDYIGRYDPVSADLIVDRMESLIRETGQSGFHFVDEAAPPAVLRAMAERLIERGITVTWWGNVRFEKAFTPELAELLARSGCIAVSGGLEVASDRLLALMKKGVTVSQVARVTRALTDAGILVHAYLMYGFPTQTEQETVDSLERVRQLFEQGCIQSAYWHRFSATAHSPIGRDPQAFGIEISPEPKVTFARNDLKFSDPTGCDHDALGAGLKKAVYNFMHGIGLETDARSWFEHKVPRARVSHDLIRAALSDSDAVPHKIS